MADLILALDWDEYVFGIGALGFGVVWCFFASFRYLRHARLMEDIPTSRVRSAAQGYAELTGIGRLMEGPPVISPLTHSPCLWWRFKIEKHVKSGKNSYWRTVDSGTSDDLFWLEDTTGKCVVDPAGARVIPGVKNVWYGSTRRPLKGPGSGGRFGGGGYRYTEDMVRIDDPLYVLGEFRSERGPTATEQREARVREILTNWKADPERMKLFDVDKDGEVSPREWEAAHLAAERQARRDQLSQPPQSVIHFIAKPRSSPHPYLISTEDQAALIPKWKRYAAACFIGFLGGGSLFIYGWIVRSPLQLFLG